MHKFVNEENWQGLAEMITKSGKILTKAGVNVIIIPSNTPHYAIEKIQSELTEVKVINLIELTVKHCKQKNYKEVAVLGTKQTMQGGLYQPYLLNNQIEQAKLPEQTVNDIDNLIKKDLIYGKTNIALQEKIEADLNNINYNAFILGCTELPEVYPDIIAGKPAIDTTRLLAHGALNYTK